MGRSLRLGLVSGAAVLAVTLVAGAATDWPQFLGPARNGTYAGPPLTDAWGAADPHGRARDMEALDVDRDGLLDLVVANEAPSMLPSPGFMKLSRVTNSVAT